LMSDSVNNLNQPYYSVDPDFNAAENSTC